MIKIVWKCINIIAISPKRGMEQAEIIDTFWTYHVATTGRTHGERGEDAGRTRRLTLEMSLSSAEEEGEETGSKAGAASEERANPRDRPAPAPPRPGDSEGSREGERLWPERSSSSSGSSWREGRRRR